MKTLSIKSLALFAIAAITFMSCSKKKEDVKAPVDPIVGEWVGEYKSNSSVKKYYYAFSIKPGGVLEVLNEENKVSGTGTWKLESSVFYAVYKYTQGGAKYNAAAKFDATEGTLSGSYGDGETDPSDGEFILIKK